jgi:hypothetical protein
MKVLKEITPEMASTIDGVQIVEQKAASLMASNDLIKDQDIGVISFINRAASIDGAFQNPCERDLGSLRGLV